MCLVHEARRLRARPALMVGYFRPFVYSKIDPGIKVWKQVEEWWVVMRVVVVHCDGSFAVGSGLFGLLGDAPVQVVEVEEEVRMKKMYDLAVDCEGRRSVLVTQDLTQKSKEEMREELKSVLVKRFGGSSEDLMTVVRPAVMFRLCTHMCNSKET